jgi:hypothetical protein
LLMLFPQYADIPQGYTYNGHWILASFISLTCAITLLIYQRFNKSYTSVDLFFAPIVLWLVINLLIAFTLPGAGFLVIPLYFALACFALHSKKHAVESQLLFSSNEQPKAKHLLLTTLLVLPSIILLSPLIPLFVIGLGLKMIFIATLLTCLTLILLVPIFCHYPIKGRLILALSLISLTLFVISSLQSGYSEDRKKPSSVNYVYDQDTNQAFMVSHNRTLDEFTQQFFDPSMSTRMASKKWDNAIYPVRYRTRIRYAKDTTNLDLKAAKVEVLKDEVTDDSRNISITITPQRATNIIQLASNNPLKIKVMSVNGQPFMNGHGGTSKKIRKGFFFRYVLSNPNEKITLNLSVAKSSELSLKVFGISFDLLEKVPGIQPRSAQYMPEPFIINDATIIGQSIKLK